MRGELKRLQSKIGITTVYVTHDQSEALALSDRIAVIDRGRITPDRLAAGHLFPARQSVRGPFRRRHQSARRAASSARRRPRRGRGAGRAPDPMRGAAADRRSGRRVGLDPAGKHPRWRAQRRRRRRATTASPAAISGVTFLGASRRVDVVSDGVTLQVTTSADLPLPADGEVLLLFAPERAVALPGRETLELLIRAITRIRRRRRLSDQTKRGDKQWQPRNTRPSRSRRRTASPG